MIAMYTKNFDNVKQFHFFEINQEEDKIEKLKVNYSENETESKPVGTDDEDQLKLPDQLKQLTQEIRKELRYFSNYQFQWFHDVYSTAITDPESGKIEILP